MYEICLSKSFGIGKPNLVNFNVSYFKLFGMFCNSKDEWSIGYLTIIVLKLFRYMYTKQGYASKNWVDGLSDEAYYPWESPKFFWLKSVNPSLVNEQKNVLFYC